MVARVLSAGALGDPGDCHPCHSGGTACGQASCRPVAEWGGLARAALAGAAWWAANQDWISNQERTGKKCGEDTTCNLWYVKADDFRSIWVCSQPFHLRALEPLSRTSPWRSIRNRCHDGNGGPYLDSTWHFWLTKKGLRGFLTIFQPDLYWDDYPIAGNGRPGSSLASKKGVLVDDLWASMFEAPSNLPV